MSTEETITIINCIRIVSEAVISCAAKIMLMLVLNIILTIVIIVSFIYFLI